MKAQRYGSYSVHIKYVYTSTAGEGRKRKRHKLTVFAAKVGGGGGKKEWRSDGWIGRHKSTTRDTMQS